ncbi:MAG: OmpH family outer membrane protein [Bacteroidaceae bacterium]|nr:OmpH family outer membrane protein [Bacteroidaceae bacterium]
MKKILFLAAALALTACGGDKPADKKPAAKTAAAADAKGDAQQGRIAYVDLDSVNARYSFCVEQNEALEQQQKSYASTLQQKAQALQNGIADFQKKMQNGQITSEAQAKQVQSNLEAQQRQYEQLEAQYSETIANKTQALQTALLDSINNYMAVFNADGRYSLIMGKQSVSILYAAPGYDITDEFIEGLNKRYQKK